jgi:hypothetical protein
MNSEGRAHRLIGRQAVTTEFRREECPNFAACGYCPKHQREDLCPLLLEFFGSSAQRPTSRLDALIDRMRAGKQRPASGRRGSRSDLLLTHGNALSEGRRT